MTRKEYINKLKNLIINRIKYHSPLLKDDNIDYKLLDAVGVDCRYPIFIFKKPLDKIFYQAFLKAKSEVDFNLILTKKPQISSKKINNLDKSYIFYENEISPNFLSNLEALNINYVTHSGFEKKLEGELLKINGRKMEFDYIPYFYNKKYMENSVIFETKSFLLNGKNFIINMINTSKENRKVSIELNFPLPRGYYFFKRENNCIVIENLTSKEKAYFNFNFRNAKISFSSMDGIESCTYACVNVKAEIELLPQQTKKIFYSFSNQKFCLFTPKEMKSFFSISQQKMNEVFDVKMTSRDKAFDNNFNFELPKKVWESWHKFGIDQKSENEWIKIKNDILLTSKKGVQINEKIKGLKEVKFFRNLTWKRVFILHNDSCYMFADKVKYYNYTLLTKDIFNKNDEIYLSFAD